MNKKSLIEAIEDINTTLQLDPIIEVSKKDTAASLTKKLQALQDSDDALLAIDWRPKDRDNSILESTLNTLLESGIKNLPEEWKASEPKAEKKPKAKAEPKAEKKPKAKAEPKAEPKAEKKPKSNTLARKEFMESHIEKGIDRKELIKLVVEKFGCSEKVASIKISDGKNPKYNKFKSLVIQKENFLSFEA